MSKDIIQIDYEEIERVAASFGEQAETVIDMRSVLYRCFQDLQNGGWAGTAADAFFSEMDHLVLPIIDKLSEALEEGKQTTLQISEIMSQAEEAPAEIP